MWIGRYTVGQSIPLGITTTDGSGAPTMPDSAPTADIYDNGAVAASSTIKLPIFDRYAISAAGTTNCVFGRPYRLDSGFTVGRYTILYKWIVSAVTYKTVRCFDVIYDTDADGPVTGLFPVPRTTGTIVHYDTESGKVVYGRNPH